MLHRSQLPPRPRFPPPQRNRDFDPLLYPKLKPSAVSEPRDDRRLHRLEKDFLAAYYSVNREYAALLRIRSEQPGTTRSTVRERAQLRRVERALRRRDALEDYCAPLGVVAEPGMRNGFAVELTIQWGPPDLGAHRSPAEVQIFSAFIPLDRPSDFVTSSLLAGLDRALSDR